MAQENKKLNHKQRKKLIHTFLISVGATLALCTVLIIAGVVIYNNTIASETVSEVNNELTEEEKIFEEEKEEVSELNKTIAVFGVDQDEVRTDVIFVVNFNTITNKVKVISIPRDTKVYWSDKQQRALKQLTGNTRAVSKINEMSAYGRIHENVGNIRDFTIDEIENILRVSIDSYVVVNLEAFKEIVDAIGGVEMYVPQNMYYQDQSQGLYINLKEGQQVLDGDKAEQLVRFRSYPRGDEARVEVQQIFLTAFAEKVFSQSPVALSGMVTKLFPYVKTDIKLNQVMEYLEILKQFSMETLSFYIVPGYGSMQEGPSYYYINEEMLDEMIKEVFLDTTVAGEPPEVGTSQDRVDAAVEAEEEIVEDKSVQIAVYNATNIKGVAANYQETLQDLGYNVVNIGNYKESGLSESTIYAKDQTKAMQFLQYVEGAEIVEDSSIEYDIEIVIGTKAADSYK